MGLTSLAPIAAGAAPAVVLDLILVVAASAVVVTVLGRLKVSVIPALLVTGVLIGPYALGLVSDASDLDFLSQLAVILLLFGVGLELHLDALREGAVRLLLGGLIACVGATAVLWPLAAGVAGSAPLGLLIAMALSLSSTAVVLKYLGARRELGQAAGRLSLAILVIQDLLVIAMLAAVPMLAQWAGAPTIAGAGGEGFRSVGDLLLKLGGIALLIVIGRKALPWLLRHALLAGGTEALFLAGIASALGAAGICAGLGFSLELGAFLAGFLLADTPFQEELSGQVMPVRDLFLAIFFTTLGMQVDPLAALPVLPQIALALVVLLVAKGIVIALGCWLVGTHATTSIVVGLLLAQAGEFSLILLAKGERFGMLPDELHGGIIVLVVLGLLVMPAVAALGRWLALRVMGWPLAPGSAGSRMSEPYAPVPAAEGDSQRVIIAGYGPVGQAVAEAVRASGCTPVIVDLNPETIADLRAGDHHAVLGDVRNEAVLRGAGVESAAALIMTVPGLDVAERGVSLARRLAPRIWIAVRSPFAATKQRIRDAGADVVASDEDSMAEGLALVVRAHFDDAQAASAT